MRNIAITEDIVWAAIKGSRDPAIFDEFVSKYASSPHIADARQRRDELTKEIAAAQVPTRRVSPPADTDHRRQGNQPRETASPEQRRHQRQCPRCGRIVKLHDAICMGCGHELEFPEVGIEPESAALPR